MKVKCKNDFVYNGNPISIKEKTTLHFLNPNSWIKDKLYEARFYSGGIMCPIPAYFVMSETNEELLFTISEAKPTYELFSEHFELIK